MRIALSGASEVYAEFPLYPEPRLAFRRPETTCRRIHAKSTCVLSIEIEFDRRDMPCVCTGVVLYR
ncbi:hypothetical protein EB73_34970 [Mycobacterium sp. SWH-M3]|nr:hypothetical protein EB73_34970 [Mycobacterium sp. SWH-M3]